jgi:acyl carrier protein
MDCDLQQEVLAVLGERFDVDPAVVTAESRLREDLDLDSIDLFDIMGLIEQRTGVGVELSDFMQAKTFGDFIAVLERVRLKAQVA